MDKKITKKNTKQQKYSPYKPSNALIKELEEFIEYVPPQRLSKNLRNLFLEFLPHYIKDAVPNNFEVVTEDLYFLFEFLDKAGEEVERYEGKMGVGREER